MKTIYNLLTSYTGISTLSPSYLNFLLTKPAKNGLLLTKVILFNLAENLLPSIIDLNSMLISLWRTSSLSNTYCLNYWILSWMVFNFFDFLSFSLIVKSDSVAFLFWCFSILCINWFSIYWTVEGKSMKYLDKSLADP